MNLCECGCNIFTTRMKVRGFWITTITVSDDGSYDIDSTTDFVESDSPKTCTCADCGRIYAHPDQPFPPLFIPLKRKFFEAFKAGTKNTEYRRRGPRWNMDTCFIGRRVVLSLGYGKKERLLGKITACNYDTVPSKIPGWLECYGDHSGDACCIKIELDGGAA